MKIPPFLIAAALLFWGWQVDLLLPAITVALVVEIAPRVKMRWQLSGHNYSRLVDLSALLFLGLLVFAVFTAEGSGSFLRVFAWLPLVMLPVFLAQLYGSRETIPLSALFLVIRKRSKKSGIDPGGVDVAPFYFAFCLLSSGIGNDRNIMFFFGLFGLLGWALWMVRNRGFAPWLWLLLFGAAGVLGYAGQIGLHQLHTIVEEKVLEVMGYSGAGDEDPFQTETAIGSVGRLKLSEKIVLRVSGENGRVPPAYLRNGSYDIYSGRSWLNASRSVQKITPEQSGKEWIIHPGAKEQNGSWLTIDTRIDSQGGILPVPPGTIRLRGLSAEQVEASRSGFIRLSGVAGRIRADILADPLQPSDIAPGEIDLSVSKSQRAMLAELIGEYGLERENQAASLEAIGDYFRDHFSYTLVQKESGDHADPMSRFLHKTRAGHCEYFATATVLLCRMAGIPARYATGWVVSEYSRLEQCYLVRARHAHAWAMVYVGGRWQVLDTTPGEWLDLEEESSSVLTPLGDLFSWGWYHLCLWWSRLLSGLGSGGLWFLVPVAAWLIYRLSRLKKKRVKGEVVESDGAVLEKRGLDSDFVLVEQFFSGVGLGRLESETPLQWCGRLEGITEQELHYHRLRKLVMCHYNHRFNPGCDAKQSRHKLKAEVDRYLALLDRERIEKMP